MAVLADVEMFRRLHNGKYKNYTSEKGGQAFWGLNL
jgi:hypothetical protein